MWGFMSSELLGGARRVLFVHAHPDDETLATGGLIAALADAGVEVFLLTGTRGEQGEIVPGSFTVPGAVSAGTLSAEQAEALAQHRIAEVRASVGKFVFASDYEAVFQDTDDQLFTTEDVRRAFTPGLRPLFPEGLPA